MNTDPNASRTRRGEWGKVREDVNRVIGSAAGQVERETERLLAYLNEEVIPAVRSHSSRALRTAAEKLARFADYLERQKKSSSGS